jgi:hypothetical protein
VCRYVRSRQSPAYRSAWGEFVIAQLKQRHPELRGRTIEVHARMASPAGIPGLNRSYVASDA